MKNHEKTIDQHKLAESLSKSIKYSFLDYFLVKPLPPVKVEKEFSKPISTKETVDKEGVSAKDYEDVEKEVRVVDSDYTKGVVLKCPNHYILADSIPEENKIHIGDVIVYRSAAGRYFDLLKDSQLVKHFDIIAIEKDA